MQIISGLYKGRKLAFPKDRQFRPTQPKVRAAVFNMLQGVIEGSIFLDLFAGTGAMGIEALSRGASKAVFVDKDTRTLRQNLEMVSGQYNVVSADIGRYFDREKQQFDIVFLDPPWDQPKLYEVALKGVWASGILKPDFYLICEHHRKQLVSNLLPDLKRVEYPYGDAQLTVFRP